MVPNLLIGKGFDASILAYERVNQLDLLAANGTFLSQPMVRKAMVVIEVQIGSGNTLGFGFFHGSVTEGFGSSLHPFCSY